MEKSLKYCLSFILIVLFFSCTEKEYSSLSENERKALSFKIFNDGGHLPQGSPKSMTRIEKAIKINPENCDAIRELSVAYLKRGMPNKWKPQFDKAIACDPKIWQPMRGYLYLWFYRDYKKAIADFDASDTLTPKFIDAPQGHTVDYWRGIAYLGLKDYEKSNAYFEKDIANQIKDFGEDYVDITAFLYNGISYFESGDYGKALASFNKQLEYSRNLSADAKYYIAQILIAEHKSNEALEVINEAISDYEMGYNNKRPYVETLRQLYPEDLLALKEKIVNN